MPECLTLKHAIRLRERFTKIKAAECIANFARLRSLGFSANAAQMPKSLRDTNIVINDAQLVRAHENDLLHEQVVWRFRRLMMRSRQDAGFFFVPS
jgi:hypothetical protein